MTRDIAAGLRWRRMIARIADRRADRRKNRKVTSAPTTPPEEDQVLDESGMGSPAIVGSSRYHPSLLTSWNEWTSALPVGMTVVKDWPEENPTGVTQIGAQTPIVTDRPPL